MKIYRLDILLSQFWTSPCSVSSSNCCFLLHTDFSGGRSGGLVFPSLEEFSTIDCDPLSQRLWCSQWCRGRCFSGTLLLFQWYNKCWQFHLWFLRLFETQLIHLEVLGYALLKPILKNFELNLASMWNECNCPVVWTFLDMFLGIPLRLEWKLSFSSPVATAEFSKFAGVLNAAL